MRLKDRRMDSEASDSVSEAAPLYTEDDKLRTEANGNHSDRNGHADVQL